MMTMEELKNNDSVSNALPPLTKTGGASADKSVSLTDGSGSARPFSNEKKHNVVVEEKLAEQFRYFRGEYIDASNNIGLTVTIDMVEDKVGHIYNFVLNGGPKFVFQTMQNNRESIQLLRCALSLLIITVTILRRKATESFEDGTQSPNESKKAMHLSISTWAQESASKIVDASSLSTCINIMISSSNSVVQELVLNLLTSMLSISDDAVKLMFLPLSSLLKLDEQNKMDYSTTTAISRRQPTLPTQRSANEKFAAETRTDTDIDFSKFNFKFNKTDAYKKKKRTKSSSSKQDALDTSNSGLSYVMSVVVLQKNRHLLVAGLADLIIAMLTRNPLDMAEPIARTSTCFLPAADATSSTTATKPKRSSYSSNPAEPVAPTARNPNANEIIEWAGVKILLKYLFRYQAITKQPKSDNVLNRDTVSAALRLQDEVLYTHSKVLLATCKLVASSSTVAAYVNDLVGAEDLIQISALVHSNPLPQQIRKAVRNCVFALNYDKEQREETLLQKQETKMIAKQKSEMKLAAMTRSPKSSAGSPVRPVKLGGAGSIQGSKSSSSATGSETKAKRPDLKVFDMSETLMKVDHENIEMMPGFSKSFDSKYEVATEKRALYLAGEKSEWMNKTNNSQANSTSRILAQQKRANTTNYLSSSLAAIDVEANKAVIGQHKARNPLDEYLSTVTLPPHLGVSQLFQGEMTIEDLNRVDRAIGEQRETEGSWADGYSVFKEEGKGPEDRSRPGILPEILDLRAHKFDANKQFFKRLPIEPNIPTRIEPKDVVGGFENLEQIRAKFTKIAQDAIGMISDKGYMKNGKSSVSIEERARRGLGITLDSPERPTSSALAASQPDRMSTMDSIPYDQSSRAGVRPVFSEDGVHERNEYFVLLNESMAELPMMPSEVEENDDAFDGGRFRLNPIEFDEDGIFGDFKPIFDYETVRDPDEDSLMVGVYSVPTTPGIRHETRQFSAKFARTLNSALENEKNEVEASIDLLL